MQNRTPNIAQAVKHSFNKAAKTYDQYAQIQVTAGETLIDFLQIFADDFTDVIDVGCGTGQVTKLLAKEVFYKNLEAIDIAESLLPSTPQSAHLPIHFHAGDFNAITQRDKKYDLIFSNMSLHWSECFSETIAELNNALADDGILAFSIPLQGTFSEIENTFNINQFFDLETISQLLASLNFRVLYLNKQHYSTHFQDTHTALRSIKNTGANYVYARKQKSLLGKSALLDNDITELSYVIGYFIVKKRA